MLKLNDIELLNYMANRGYIKVSESGKDFINESINKIDSDIERKLVLLEEKKARIDKVKNKIIRHYEI